MRLFFSFGLQFSVTLSPFAWVSIIIFEALALIFCFSLLLRNRFFQVLVLLEVGVLLFIYVLALEGVCVFRLLFVFVLGACESSIGLGVSVSMSRAVGVTSFRV